MESLNLLRKSFKTGITKSLEFRKLQLKSLFKMLEDHEKDFCKALKKDLNKSNCESMMTEVLLCKQEISVLIKHMDSWLATEKVPKSFLTLTDAVWVERKPFGVALCIGAWNYPLMLAIQPLAGLLAAGNCVILKPSEIAENSAKLLFELIPKYVNQNVCRVELGDAKRTGEILKERFDYIMYTGSATVGKIVMEAAAKHMTPVLLECGGKSPVYIDKDVHMKMAVKRVIWGRFLNAGQTCLAPDYVLCHKDVKEEFLRVAVETIEEFYPSKASPSPDLSRIINNAHYKRLMNLIKQTSGKILVGGEGNEDSLYICPTVVVLNSVDDILMKGEIFGPILPVITVDSEDEAIDIINNGDKPLAIYVFSNTQFLLTRFNDETSSGSIVYNDCVVHTGVKGLPFGGVGSSGIGQYHGKFSIDSFTQPRGVLDKDTSEIVNNLFRYPPYNAKKESWAEWGLRSNPHQSGYYCSIM